MKDKIFLIDSNILVYAYDKSFKGKHEASKRLINKCFSGKEYYALSLQNLSEFFVIVTRKIKIPINNLNARNIIYKMLNIPEWIILQPKETTIIKAIDISIEFNVNYYDALIAATMYENGIFNIYTEDEAFKKIKWMNVVNPFKKERKGN